MAVTSEQMDAIRRKSNQELGAILASDDEWNDEYLTAARAELECRISDAEHLVATFKNEKARHLESIAKQTLTAMEYSLAVLCGIVSVIGLVLMIHLTSGFKEGGYLNKARIAWRVYLVTILIKVSLIMAMIVIRIIILEFR